VRHELVRLGDVASFIRGVTFKPEDVVSLEAKRAVACMRTRNVQEELDLSDVWGISEDLVKRDDQYLIEGDVLVSSANSWNLVGKCCVVPRLPWRATFGGFVSVLRPERRKVDPRYLFRWFASDRIQKTVRSFGQQTTNIANLNIDRCLGLMIPLPSIAEQQRIAQILNKADALRAKRRAALAQLDTLTQSIFHEMFGDPASSEKRWRASRIGDVADVQGGLQLSSTRKQHHREVPYLRVANVHRRRLDLNLIKTMTPSDAEIARTRLVTDDLLVVEGHGNVSEIGRSALWDGSIPECVHQNHLIRVRFHPNRIVPVYACEYLNSPSGRRHLLRAGKTTSGLNTITVSEVRSTPIAVPPVELQQNFALRMAAVSELRSKYQAALGNADALFASLQHRAFRGEL